MKKQRWRDRASISDLMAYGPVGPHIIQNPRLLGCWETNPLRHVQEALKDIDWTSSTAVGQSIIRRPRSCCLEVYLGSTDDRRRSGVFDQNLPRWPAWAMNARRSSCPEHVTLTRDFTSQKIYTAYVKPFIGRVSDMIWVKIVVSVQTSLAL